MKIVDNFLNREDFFFVKESILGSRMYWLYEDHKVSKNDNDLQATQFYHMFCEFYKASNLIYMVEPIFKKLNIIALYRVKANLEPYKEIKNIAVIFTMILLVQILENQIKK